MVIIIVLLIRIIRNNNDNNKKKEVIIIKEISFLENTNINVSKLVYFVIFIFICNYYTIIHVIK